MSSFSPYDHQHSADEAPSAQGAVGAVAILVLLFVAFALAAPHDPSKPERGVACSVLSEMNVSTVLGTQMQLMPTNGTVCRYVATSKRDAPTVFIVARHGLQPPAGADPVPADGFGESTYRVGDTVYVRHAARAYTVIVAPTGDGGARFDQELHLARAMNRAIVAQNR